MPARSKLQTLLLMIVIAVGLTPLFYFATVEIGSAQASSADALSGDLAESPADRFVENVAFGIGEKFSFDINYGFINAGSATMEVVRLVEYANRPCYQIVTGAQSNSFFSTFYKVEDRVESIIDAVGLFSWRFEKNLREGGYKADREYTFDHKRHVVFYENDTISVSPFAQDPVSTFYYVRTQNLEPGKSVFVENFTDGKSYALEVRVLRREKISVEAGTFDCVVVEPLMQGVGVFKAEGRLTVWLTDDRLKMPVLMKSKVLVGSISAELTDFELGDIELF